MVSYFERDFHSGARKLRVQVDFGSGIMIEESGTHEKNQSSSGHWKP